MQMSSRADVEQQLLQGRAWQACRKEALALRCHQGCEQKSYTCVRLRAAQALRSCAPPMPTALLFAVRCVASPPPSRVPKRQPA